MSDKLKHVGQLVGVDLNELKVISLKDFASRVCGGDDKLKHVGHLVGVDLNELKVIGLKDFASRVFAEATTS